MFMDKNIKNWLQHIFTNGDVNWLLAPEGLWLDRKKGKNIWNWEYFLCPDENYFRADVHFDWKKILPLNYDNRFEVVELVCEKMSNADKPNLINEGI